MTEKNKIKLGILASDIASVARNNSTTIGGVECVVLKKEGFYKYSTEIIDIINDELNNQSNIKK